ncbi:MAG: aspartate aminotransferase family protein [Lysobacterales bacterium]
MDQTTQNLISRRDALLGPKAPLFYDQPLHMVKGEGVWLVDADGRRYLDVYNNVPNVGHCHPKVVEAICRQAQALNVHTRYLHETILNYGEKLTGRLDPTLSMVFLTCSGTEANELALRMARDYTQAAGIICTNATYHGNSEAVYALATQFNDGKPLGPNVKSVSFPDSYRRHGNLHGQALVDAYVQQVEQAIAEFQQEGVGFAGLLVCPIFANEGLPDVPDGYLQRVSDVVRTAGGVVIFDEVQSAFGRTGHFWGHEISAVSPDILVLGKPMGNGHPLAGAICRPELGNGFRDHSMYFNTFGGNPVSCAAGLAVLEVIDEESLVDNARNVGGYVRAGLDRLADQFELIGEVRNQGLFFAVDLVEDRETKKPAAEPAQWIVNEMKRQGVLISRIGLGDNILKMRPPLCFSHDNADQLLSTLETALTKVSRNDKQ